MARHFLTISFAFLAITVLLKDKIAVAQILSGSATLMTGITNYRSTSGALSELSALGVTVCARECSLTTDCESFFYNKRDKLCQLHDIVFEDIGPNLTYVSQTYYYRMNAQINECDSNPCQNGGSCSDMVNGYTCSCAAGYTGNDCQTEINECASSPCVNGGTCNDVMNGYTCTCASGYTGDRCQTELQCAQGWSKYQSSCYRLEATIEDYLNAKGSCENLGGHLADVTSQDEMDFLEQLYMQSHSTSAIDGVWVSTTDINVENEWVLSDGSAASYLNWHDGQPDKEFDYDDCVQVWPHLGFQWNDVYCNYQLWFYCEYEL